MDKASAARPQRVVAQDGRLFVCRLSREGNALSAVAILQDAYDLI
jgi:hypothetical protein